MQLQSSARWAIIATAVLALGAVQAASREQCEQEFKPHSGQQGKDVIWVPTPDSLVTSMLKAAGTTAKDYVIDLGSGDGKIPIAAAKEFGAKALGIEYNPEMVKLAQCYVKAEGVQNKVQIAQGDIFETDFSAATVLTLYLLPDLNEKLRPTILHMRPGTRVVSHSFTMGDWRPDERIDGNMAYLWIVPAKVEGTWELQPSDGSKPLRLRLQQQYQDISGSLSAGNKEEPLREASLRGEQIAFMYIDERRKRIEFKGKLDAEQMRLSTSGSRKSVTYTGKRV